MFCTNCGHKIKADYNFCVKCGAKIAQSIVKQDDIINLKDVMLVCEKTNWGQFPHDSGKWLSTKWTIHNDGVMICETKYDSCSFINMKERKEIKETVLDEKNFIKLKTWIKDVFPTLSLGGGCDGTGWKVTSFDENGKPIHNKSGYIENILEINDILEIINEKI